MSKVGKAARFKTRALTWDIYTEFLIFAKTNNANENYSIWAKNILSKDKELMRVYQVLVIFCKEQISCVRKGNYREAWDPGARLFCLYPSDFLISLVWKS